MRLGERIERGIFTTLIEVFPPNFSVDPAREPLVGIRQKLRDTVARVRKIEGLADGILVADMKDPGRLQLASVYTASVLKEELGAEVVPVIPTRDMNRKAIRTAFLTCLSLGLDSVSMVWGDPYAEGDGSKNVYDYRSLAEAIADVRSLADRADVDATLFAAVDIASLRSPRGLRIADARIEAGSDALLAQPPTADTSRTLGAHVAELRRAGLEKKVLHNVFPFRSRDDVRACRERFGWDLPPQLDAIAAEGERRLLVEARGVADALREGGAPGVYVSTR
ncbi:MAG: methylenetetrahydrofolate reductase, partial [Nitrososphaerales archaeon]